MPAYDLAEVPEDDEEAASFWRDYYDSDRWQNARDAMTWSLDE